jgi:DNA-binding transcriptional MerR regulator
VNTGTKVGDLAKTTLCLIEMVRYYERECLLPAPTRSRGDYRL